MVHREAHDWYSYNIDDMDISLLKEAKKKGCDIGYHNNSLSNVQRQNRVGNYCPEILAEASKRFEEDVRYLRKYFKIQIFTHHGGNSLNLKIPVPEGLDIMCVDKPFNSSLWEKINSGFN